MNLLDLFKKALSRLLKKKQEGSKTEAALIRCIFMRDGWARAHNKYRLGLQQKEEYLWYRFRTANRRVELSMVENDKANKGAK